MERQRSFSVKTSTFLVFSLAICSSVIFLVVFSIWVVKAIPAVHQETHFQVRNPALGLAVKPLTVHSSTAFSTDNLSTSGVSNSVLVGTQFRIPRNRSGFANFSRNEVSGDEKDEDHVVNRDLADDGDDTLSRNTSGFSEDSIFMRLHKMENESKVLVEGMPMGDAVKGNVTTGQQNVSYTSSEKDEVSNGEGIKQKNGSFCDVTKGRWVLDGKLPLYTNGSCPFIDEGFNCEGNGRLNKGYMKWRWQPQDCEIPRFNATKMLELIRGKRLVFVGDSINRNQWESMLCLLMGAIKDPRRVYEARGRRVTKEKGDYSFKFVDYKCTVEYYVTHFLVHESKARVGKKRVQTLRIDTMDRGSSRWKRADILVFNSAHWWNHFKTKAGTNYYQEGDQVHPRLDVLTAFRRSIITWASWVDKHINPSKTRVFFRSSAPSHFRGGQWNSGGHCREAIQPLNETSGFIYPEKNRIVEDVIRRMRTPVTFLNVTGLSEYRTDGHPSVYGRKSGKIYSSSAEDCSHWCLPGVPDTWNELLYSHLQLTWKRDL
ncbi:protein trichome birefringence-like 6 [Diospyros lotus]|uniref:protein trichome birefringence-like 6 n=1 Tax=Diospyros lotus TaxID=55363 RepID=UPI00225B439D|nr:protein trichome birefringence-like 6 [Diospyros lotus]